MLKEPQVHSDVSAVYLFDDRFRPSFHWESSMKGMRDVINGVRGRFRYLHRRSGFRRLSY